MPKSKHRRKPGEKATTHPGRGKQPKLTERQPGETAKSRREVPDLRGLPLFNPRTPRG